MIIKMKEALYNDATKIENILHKIGCTYIKHIKNKITFGHDEQSTGNANHIRIDTLYYRSYSLNIKGDIFTLIAEMLHISLKDSFQWLAKELNLSFNYSNKDIELPFGGFFINFEKNREESNIPLKTYDINVNEEYSKAGVSKLFIDDGIGADIQEMFQIGYDVTTNRVTIPWLNEFGDLIGIMGRLNKEQLSIDEKKYKYFPIIAFNKSQALYGFYQNYNDILKAGYIFISESEKSVLKGREMGFNNVVALGCKTITTKQMQLIKSTHCKIVIALDEGVDLNECILMAQQLKIQNVFFSNEVYIVDMDRNCNPYINKEKISIFDLDKNSIVKVLENHLIYID